jgi:hypothetical protein
MGLEGDCTDIVMDIFRSLKKSALAAAVVCIGLCLLVVEARALPSSIFILMDCDKNDQGSIQRSTEIGEDLYTFVSQWFLHRATVNLISYNQRGGKDLQGYLEIRPDITDYLYLDVHYSRAGFSIHLKLKAAGNDYQKIFWWSRQNKDEWGQIGAFLRSIPAVFEGLSRNVPEEGLVYVGCLGADDNLETSRNLTIGLGTSLSQDRLALGFWVHGILTSDEFDEMCVTPNTAMATKLFNYVIHALILPPRVSAGVERVEVRARVEIKKPPGYKPFQRTGLATAMAADLATFITNCWGRWDAQECN